MEILMDTRESDETKEILNLFLKAEEKMLLVGDVIVDNTVVFELKKPNDFIASVFDGRLFNQIEKMQMNYSHTYILVVGSITDLFQLSNNMNCYNAIKAAVSSCFVRGSPVIFCDDLPTMTEIIKSLSEKLTDNKDRPVSQIIKLPIHDPQLKIICSIDGINEKIGQRLLDHFGSPKSIFMASPEELMEVKGIGKKIADHIQNVLWKNE